MDCARDVAHVAGAVGAQRRPSVVDLHTLEQHVLGAVAEAPLERVRVVGVACANKVSETDVREAGLFLFSSSKRRQAHPLSPELLKC